MAGIQSNLPPGAQLLFGTLGSYGIVGLSWGGGGGAGLPVAQPVAPPSAPVVTGIDPNEIANALYSKPIPLSALGLARIGTAGLIFGPYFNNGAASFAVSFGFPADPAGTRKVYEIALDGKVVWELAAGSAAGAISAAGFIAEAFTCRFYGGTLTQTADSLESTYFGAEAIAYRPQMMLWFENLPLAQFGNRVPFVSCIIGDTTGGATPSDGINLGTALERVAYSPWLEYDSTLFDTTGVADIVQGMILTEDQTFLDLLRNTARFYRTLDILQNDKLRVNDRGATSTPDLTLDRSRIVAEAGVQYMKQEESSVPRELEFITIDPDADYVMMPSKASRPRDPVPVTSSVGKDTMFLPVIIGATTRASAVTYAKYQEENARKRIALRGMLYTYEIEPGDLFAPRDLADGFDPVETFKVLETSHNGDWTVDIVGEAILKCALPSNPQYESVSFYESANQTSIYTFTGVDIGAAAADRLVLISGAVRRGQSVGRDISSVTINGVACSDLDFLVAGDGAPSANVAVTVFMASMVVPTGTTCTVVVTASNIAAGAFIHATRLTELNSTTPSDSDSNADFGGDPTLALDIPDNGVCIAVYAGDGTAAVTWTGLSNENVDQEIITWAWRGSIASQGSLNSETGRTITATTGNTAFEAIMARSYS